MEIKKIPLNKLIENNWNPNFFTDKEFQKLVKQIKEHGMRQPILVREQNGFFEILDGAHRTRASKEAGLMEIDCVVVKLNTNESKMATVAMNQLKGKMDDVSLAKLLENLKENLTLEEVADSTGLDQQKIEIYLRLLEFPENLADKVEEASGTITINFIVTLEQQKLVEKTLNQIDGKNKAFALIWLCNWFNEKQAENKIHEQIKSQDEKKGKFLGIFGKE